MIVLAARCCCCRCGGRRSGVQNARQCRRRLVVRSARVIELFTISVCVLNGRSRRRLIIVSSHIVFGLVAARLHFLALHVQRLRAHATALLGRFGQLAHVRVWYVAVANVLASQQVGSRCQRVRIVVGGGRTPRRSNGSRRW